MMHNDVASMRGVGPVRLQALTAAGLHTAEDLLRCRPRGYKDLSAPTRVCDVRPGRPVCVRGTICEGPVAHRGGQITTVTAQLQDGTGRLRLLWYNQPYLTHRLRKSQAVLLYGTAQLVRGALTLVCPSIEKAEADGELLPVYALPDDVPQAVFRDLIGQALALCAPEWPEALPAWLRQAHALPSAREALYALHAPQNAQEAQEALRREAFLELLLYQCARLVERAARPTGAPALPVSPETVAPLQSALPYRLTSAQARALSDILADLGRDTAMARMVQGDVGSGKTAVALLALYAVAACGGQGALMAPTEVLAGQHFEGARELLEPLGVRVGLLTGSVSGGARKAALRALAEGEWQVVVGTHALLTPSVAYKNLQLAVADEQHRFGVRQRDRLLSKGKHPHMLVMSATPIPRSLSLVLYGDLDISVIDELPPGRTPIRTRRVPEEKRAGMMGFIRDQIAEGRQAYYICPLVEESEALDVASACDMAKTLQQALPGVRVGLLHGKLPAQKKDEIADRFRTGDIDLLVATTVVEVGVNVPNATVMVIEDADRFGLSQLHQLRGRVGRSTYQSYCFVLGEGSERLSYFCSTTDGFALAQKDLELRGPGELMGTRQHGMPDRSLLTLAGDVRMLAETRDAALDALRRAREGDGESQALLERAAACFPLQELSRH